LNLKEKILADLEKNPVLKTGFFETENRWNNTFNFWKKFSIKKIFQELWNFSKNFSINYKNFFETKKIFIPWIKIWEFKDLKFWDKIVFEDFDENYENGKNWEKELIRETWFEKFLWILNHENKNFLTKKIDKFPPIFICDNHNHVLESWKFFKWKNTKLIHIDQHKDDANYKKPILDFKRDLRICDYINFARDEEWIDKNYISLCELIDYQKFFLEKKWEKKWEKNIFWDNKNFNNLEKNFLEFEKKFLNKKNTWKIILNIDLDIFVDHQTMVDHEKIFKLINFLKNKVDLISIASSPLFLKKEKVMWLIEKILKNN